MITFLKKNLIFLVFAVFFLASSPLAVDAYIDLGTGSFVIQAILAVIFGIAFYIKQSWRKIGKFFNRHSSTQKENAEPK